MEVLSEKGLAEYFKVSPWAVRSWRIKGGMPYFRVSRKIFYRLSAVLAWMEEEERKHMLPEKRVIEIV